MKRKIVKQGAATLMVSLPAKWAKAQGLGKGDEVNIKEDGKNLAIRLEESAKKEVKATINVSKLAPLVNISVIALYKKGVDELEIIFDKQEVAKDIQKRTIPELLGFEIVKQTNNSLLVKDITGANIQGIDDLIKRLFFILDSMAEELSEAIKKKQPMSPIIEIDTSVNMFSNFCIRILNKKGYPELHKTPQIYGIVSQLEEIGDVYKSIAKEIQNKTKVDKDQLAILNETRHSLNLFKEAFFDFSKEKIVEFAKKYKEIKKKIKNKNKIDFHLMQLNQELVKLDTFLLPIAL